MSDTPVIRVIRGTPTAEELAALVGALLVTRRPAAPPEEGFTRWRASALPGGRTSWTGR